MGSFQSALTPLSPSDNLVKQKIKVKARFEINKLKVTQFSVKMTTADLQKWSKVYSKSFFSWSKTNLKAQCKLCATKSGRKFVPF